MTSQRLAAGLVAGGALLLCAGLATNVGTLVQGLAQAEAWHQSPGFFPIAAMAVAAVAALARLAALRRERLPQADAPPVPSPEAGHDTTLVLRPPDEDAADEFDASASRPSHALRALLVLLLYPLGIAAAGLVPATVAFVTVSAVLAGLAPRRALLVAVVLAVTLHLVFVVGFKVWFPQPWITAALKGER